MAQLRMARRQRHRRLAQWDRQFLWHPFTQMREWEQEQPLIIERAKGAYLYDTAGKKYLDGVSSIWLTVHGHRHPALDRAIRKQLEKAAHTTLLGLSHPTAIRLARELVGIAPRGLTRVFYSDDGSTAMEVALKMALQYWRQRKPAAGSKHLSAPSAWLSRRHDRRHEYRGAGIIPRTVPPPPLSIIERGASLLLSLPAQVDLSLMPDGVH